MLNYKNTQSNFFEGYEKKDGLKKFHLMIPVELCIYAIRTKFIRPFQLYIFLKAISSGKIKLSALELKEIAKQFGLKSERAITNNLKLLKSMNWISYCHKSGYYFIRGYEKVGSFHKLDCIKRVEFDLRKIKEFKAFIGGAIIGYLVNRQRWAKWINERKNGRSWQSIYKPTLYYPVANLTLSKMLKISISTAFDLKELSVKNGYAKVKKNFTETGLPKSQLKNYKRTMPELAHRVRIRKNKIVIQDTDTFYPCIRLGSRKKIETIVMGVKRETKKNKKNDVLCVN